MRVKHFREVIRYVTLVLVAQLFAACSFGGGADGVTPEPGSSPTPVPAATHVPEGATEPALTPTASPASTGTAPLSVTPTISKDGDLSGVFLEAVPATVARSVTLEAPEPPQFETWDRESVVLYDLQEEQATSFGRGFFAGFSGDGRRFGYNNAGKLWVVDIATGAQVSYEVSGGLATLVGNRYAIAPAAEGSLLDLDTGERTPVNAIADPRLRYEVQQRLRPAGGELLDDGLVLRRANWENTNCGDDWERCRAEAFEQWTVEDLASGEVKLAFRAIAAAPAGQGELVIATSPRCKTPAGGLAWCEDVLAGMRPILDRSAREQPFAEGTTNIFLVSLATGEATFVATASYNPPVFIWPMNWPLIADQDFVIWTESFCGQPQGKTRIFDRRTGGITELDSSQWVRWHGDLIGFGDFASRALFDPHTLSYVAVAPEGLSGFGWSQDLRYVAVGAILGHGGLCG